MLKQHQLWYLKRADVEGPAGPRASIEGLQAVNDLE